MDLKDTLAERLRRRPAKPMRSPRVGSNPTGVVCAILHSPCQMIPCVPTAECVECCWARAETQVRNGSDCAWRGEGTTEGLRVHTCCSMSVVARRRPQLWCGTLRVEAQDTLAERLRRRPAKPMGSPAWVRVPQMSFAQFCIHLAK